MLPTVVATPVDGTGPTIIAVHAVAPIPGEMQHWRDDLDWLADQCGDANVIMAGDFNATLDHYARPRRSETARRSATASMPRLATDNAAVGTWPTASRRCSARRSTTSRDGELAVRPAIARDRVARPQGSDHRPVLAQLTPAG